jgi:hypothetical protein
MRFSRAISKSLRLRAASMGVRFASTVHCSRRRRNVATLQQTQKHAGGPAK